MYNILVLFLIDFLCCTEVHPFDGYFCSLSQFSGLVETVESKAIHENILDLCCIQETFCLLLCAAFISFVQSVKSRASLEIQFSVCIQMFT